MPLISGNSTTAISQNTSTLSHEGRPHNQALAIAFSVARKKRATGGIAPALSPGFVLRQEARGMHQGPILSSVAGRTDHHPLNVAAGSYVLPADHVSSLGQGNTANGMAVLNRMFGSSSGPYGVGRNMPIKGGAGAPRPPAMPKADGGASDTGGARGEGVGHAVPINAAGGEYVVPPEVVTQIGHGNIKHGHAILDHWVVSNRKQHQKTLANLPGPAKS